MPRICTFAQTLPHATNVMKNAQRNACLKIEKHTHGMGNWVPRGSLAGHSPLFLFVMTWPLSGLVKEPTIRRIIYASSCSRCNHCDLWKR